MGVRLRSATAADAEQVASVYLTSRKRFLPFAPLAHSDDEVRNWIASTLIASGSVIVAEDDTRIVGMMGTSTAEGISWIDHLYLIPEAVGQGIGARMLQLAKDRLDPPIRLHTFQQNSGARKFYEDHGFRPIAWSDGAGNEARCPDVLYEFSMESESP